MFLDNLLLPGAAREGSRRLPAAVTVPTVSRGARTQEREEGDHKPEHGGRHNKDCRDEVGGLHRGSGGAIQFLVVLIGATPVRRSRLSGDQV